MPLCDVCGVRPATVTAEVVQDGERRVLHLCELDYARLREEEWFSPWESLLEGFFSPRRRPDREGADLGAYLSEEARELLQRAARVAVDFGKREMDTEHLLYALAEGDALGDLFRKAQLDPKDVRGYIEHNAPRGTFQAERGRRSGWG